jgi:PIN domain nuclease of toxin-antitoxin system
MRLTASLEALPVRLLLDTCTFLWIVTCSPRLSRNAAQLFADPVKEVFLSSVSSWEIAVKFSLGSLKLPAPPLEFTPRMREAHGIATFPLVEEDVLYLPKIPKLHRDPFDRMLISQAIVSGLTLLTPDPLISQYPVHTLW